MLNRVHELQISSEVLERFILLAFIVQIPEIKLKVLLAVHRRNNYESSFG
jgi:hypothetical protein